MVRPIDNSHLSCLGLKLRVEAVSQQIFEECSVARGLETERPESRKFTRIHVERLAPVGGDVLIEPTPLVRQFENDLLVVHVLLADIAKGKPIGDRDRVVAKAASGRIWNALREARHAI